MHELSLIRNVVDIALNRCRDLGAVKVTKVQIIVGEARDVVEEFAADLYGRLTRDTAAEGSRLEIIRTPLTVRCNVCGFVFPISLHREETWVCPSCAAKRDYHLCTGAEFMVRAVEVVQSGCDESPAPVASPYAQGA